MHFTRLWNIDQGRAAIENLPPQLYLRLSYYERWALRLQNLLTEHGLVDVDEIAAGHALRAGKPLARKLLPADVSRLTRGAYGREAKTPPRYKPDDRVRTRNLNPPTHTRLPRYARGRVGVVESIRGCHVFPDSPITARTRMARTVCFASRELWGEIRRHLKPIEAFEPYLEAVQE
jgi:nitrile hydratase